MTKRQYFLLNYLHFLTHISIYGKNSVTYIFFSKCFNDEMRITDSVEMFTKLKLSFKHLILTSYGILIQNKMLHKQQVKYKSNSLARYSI